MNRLQSHNFESFKVMVGRLEKRRSLLLRNMKEMILRFY